jgi:hypothetical protein
MKKLHFCNAYFACTIFFPLFRLMALVLSFPEFILVEWGLPINLYVTSGLATGSMYIKGDQISLSECGSAVKCIIATASLFQISLSECTRFQISLSECRTKKIRTRSMFQIILLCLLLYDSLNYLVGKSFVTSIEMRTLGPFLKFSRIFDTRKRKNLSWRVQDCSNHWSQ